MTPVEQLLESEEKLFAAIRTADVAALDALIHDDLLFHLPNGQLATKTDDLDAYRSGNMVVSSIEPGEPVVRVFGDTAVVSVSVDLKGSYFGQELDEKLRYLRVWKLVEGRWQIIAGSCTNL